MEKSFYYKGLKLNVYARKGSWRGKIYILLHGLFVTWKTAFNLLIPELAKRGHTVITLDLLGHGESSKYENILLKDVVDTA